MRMIALWRVYLQTRRRKAEAVLSLLFFVGVMSQLHPFLLHIEKRAGFAFRDPLLALFQPVDVSLLTAIVTYGSILAALGGFAFFPRSYVITFRAYGIMILFRMAAMILLPLDPPATTILLRDPLVDNFSGDAVILTRDLFFSGHTAVTSLLFLAAPHRYLKWFFGVLLAAVPTLVLLQHVHYTVDVLCAPFFSFASLKISEEISRLVQPEPGS